MYLSILLKEINVNDFPEVSFGQGHFDVEGFFELFGEDLECICVVLVILPASEQNLRFTVKFCVATNGYQETGFK